MNFLAGPSDPVMSDLYPPIEPFAHGFRLVLTHISRFCLKVGVWIGFPTCRGT